MDVPLGSDDLLRLQRDALDLVLAVHQGIRQVGGPLRSIADFDQMSAQMSQGPSQRQFGEVIGRWPGREGILIGAAIGIMVDLADHAGSAEQTDALLERAKRRAAEKDDPFT